MRLFSLSVVATAIALSPMQWSQSPTEQGSLQKTVADLDTKLFTAYNQCDLKTLSALVADDLEFYHDKTGLAVGKQVFLDSIKNNVCGQVQRKLDAASLEVYPLNHYGAVEIGTHHFYQPNHPEEATGQAKFVMLWQQKGQQWFLTRVISFDHGPATQPAH